MPPEIIELIKSGGLPSALLLALGWMWGRAQKFETERDAERAARNSDALTAANTLHEQKLLNVKAESAIDRRDDRIAALERDLDKCERTVERWQSSPRPEAAS